MTQRARDGRRIVLVAMPFGPAIFPALGLSQMKPLLERAGFGVTVRYATLQFAELLGYDDYERIAMANPTELAGDRVFAAALREDALGSTACEAVFRGPDDRLANAVRRALALAPAFIARVADAIVAESPQVGGFTSTFGQHAASLAAAKAIKARAPAVSIVFGGANCEGDMGAELVRRYPFVDAVVSGESEAVVVELMRSLASGDAAAMRPGVVAGDTRVDLDALPFPDFDEYFAELARIDPARATMPRSLMVEASRGCWWGAKHHCTFCGLNGAAMAFRSKAPERFVDEVVELSRRHGVADVTTADNIIDYRYFRTMLPQLAQRAPGLRFFFETKANLKREHVEALRAAGVTRVQPGIESLDDGVLALMRKGVTALQNVQTLKLCKENGIAVTWNLLTGFPNEDPAAYERMTRLMPLLWHLAPPDTAARIRMDRFSPFFDDPAGFGMTNVRPVCAYDDVYGGSDESLRRLAYYFDFDYADGRDVAAYTTGFVAAARRWAERHDESDLCTVDNDAGTLLVDRRDVALRPFVVLSGVDRTVYRACDEIADVRSVVAAVNAAHDGVPGDDAVGACSRLVDAGYLLEQRGRYLSLGVALERGANRALRERLTTLSVPSITSHRAPHLEATT